jgi:hypothetical protein
LPRRPAAAPGGREEPLRGPAGGAAPGRLGHGVRRPLEHQERPRRVSPAGLRPRAGRPGSQSLRPRLRAHPAGRRALHRRGRRAGALRSCGLGATQLSPPPRGGCGRDLRRYQVPPHTVPGPWGCPEASPQRLLCSVCLQFLPCQRTHSHDSPFSILGLHANGTFFHLVLCLKDQWFRVLSVQRGYLFGL